MNLTEENEILSPVETPAETPDAGVSTFSYDPPPSDAPAAHSVPGKDRHTDELISTAGFVGTMLLMAIPILGPILTLVWACGGCRKVQKRSYARARIIMAVLSLILTAALAFAAVSAAQQLLEGVDDTLLNNAGILAETLITGEIGPEAEAMLGQMVEEELDLEIELTPAEREQLSGLISAYLNGELSLPEQLPEELPLPSPAN